MLSEERREFDLNHHIFVWKRLTGGYMLVYFTLPDGGGVKYYGKSMIEVIPVPNEILIGGEFEYEDDAYEAAGQLFSK